MKVILLLLLLTGCTKVVEKPVFIPREVRVVVPVTCVDRATIPEKCPVPGSDGNTAELVRGVLLENQCLIENELKFRAIFTNCLGD